MTILTMILLILFLLWLQGAVYRKFWHRGLSLRLSFSAVEAFEGDKLLLRQELTNAKLLPLPWIIAKFQLSRNLLFLEGDSFRISDDFYQSDLYSIAMYQRVTRSQQFLCGRRGHYRIKALDLSSSNIFISDKLVRRLRCDAELTVLPKPDHSPELEIIFRQVYGDVEVRRFTNPDPFAFRGIREYDYMDDFRLINWGATAKTGSLMVNVNSSTGSRRLVILLGLEAYSDEPNEDVMEEAIRIAASAAEYFCGLGLSVGLISNGCDTATGIPVRVLPGAGDIHLHDILHDLARIDVATAQAPIRAELDELTDLDPVYLLISAYDRGDLQDSFASMLARNMCARWIVPAIADDKLWVKETEQIIRWEVIPRNAVANFYKDIAG